MDMSSRLPVASELLNPRFVSYRLDPNFIDQGSLQKLQLPVRLALPTTDFNGAPHSHLAISQRLTANQLAILSLQTADTSAMKFCDLMFFVDTSGVWLASPVPTRLLVPFESSSAPVSLLTARAPWSPTTGLVLATHGCQMSVLLITTLPEITARVVYQGVPLAGQFSSESLSLECALINTRTYQPNDLSILTFAF